MYISVIYILPLHLSDILFCSLWAVHSIYIYIYLCFHCAVMFFYAAGGCHVWWIICCDTDLISVAMVTVLARGPLNPRLIIWYSVLVCCQSHPGLSLFTSVTVVSLCTVFFIFMFIYTESSTRIVWSGELLINCDITRGYWFCPWSYHLNLISCGFISQCQRRSINPQLCNMLVDAGFVLQMNLSEHQRGTLNL